MRKYYTKKKCIDCGVEFEGGSTSLRCRPCYRVNWDKKVKERNKSITTMRRLNIQCEECLFCGLNIKKYQGKIYLEIHHIDLDILNNNLYNLICLCRLCHRRLHSRIYKPILKRFFKILRDERFNLEQIGEPWGYSKQYVSLILKHSKNTLRLGVDNSVDKSK